MPLNVGYPQKIFCIPPKKENMIEIYKTSHLYLVPGIRNVSIFKTLILI